MNKEFENRLENQKTQYIQETTVLIDKMKGEVFEALYKEEQNGR